MTVFRFTVAAPRGNDALRRRRPAFHPDSPVEYGDAYIPVRFACGESIPHPAGNYKKKETERKTRSVLSVQKPSRVKAAQLRCR